MLLEITSKMIDVTPSIREYVTSKFEHTFISARKVITTLSKPKFRSHSANCLPKQNIKIFTRQSMP